MASTILFHHIFFALLFFFETLVSQASSRLISDNSIFERHEQWMAHHGRVYKNTEERYTRLKIFEDNVERIRAFNAGPNQGYKLSVNEFADLTNEEFRAYRTGLKGQSTIVVSTSKEKAFRYANVTDLPTYMDWRKQGAVTSIKNQGTCGSCWAFSAVAAIEGINQIKTGHLISLSEQELIDCDVKGEDQGCEGGLMDNAFQFIKQNKGLTTEANYPYVGEDGTCKSENAKRSTVKIIGYEDVPSNNEVALLQAVANQPVSVAIEGSGFEFQFYSSGVFTGSCGLYLNHAVTAIGYGTTNDGTKYWLVKNSWGSKWGENGYMRIRRDVAAKEGLCGIAMDASYPIM